MQHRRVLGAFRSTFLTLFDRLERLAAAPYTQAQLCLEIQETLIARIKYLEGRIRTLKSQVRATPNLEEKEFYGDGLAQYREVLFLLKNVGDCIAFTYINSWDIKPLAYGHDPGFISGKKGFKLERLLLRECSKNGIPCLLTDITNVLRHGDALVFREGATPGIIEVKSGQIDRRGRRQLKKLNDLHEYLTTDRTSKFFRGGQTVHRRSSKIPASYHRDEIYNLVREASLAGSRHAQIENGLRYIALVDEATDAIPASIAGFQEPLVYYLNSNRFTRPPVPYAPTILALRSSEFCWNFYNGDLILAVIVDMAFVKGKMRSQGFELLSPSDDSEVLEFAHPKLGSFKVSRALFDRVGFEFLSLEWLLNHCLDVASRPLSGRAEAE